MSFIGEKGYLRKWECPLPKGNYKFIIKKGRIEIFEPNTKAATERQLQGGNWNELEWAQYQARS